jgi:hypothetical protein
MGGLRPNGGRQVVTVLMEEVAAIRFVDSDGPLGGDPSTIRLKDEEEPHALQGFDLD